MTLDHCGGVESHVPVRGPSGATPLGELRVTQDLRGIWMQHLLVGTNDTGPVSRPQAGFLGQCPRREEGVVIREKQGADRDGTIGGRSRPGTDPLG
jgi:hypothetical protein